MKTINNLIKQNVLYIAWTQSLVATFGSLYYSEVRNLPPCLLCWYQRIVMYPLVIIIAVGIIRKDKNLPYYTMPLSLIGMIISFYHYLLQRGIIPDQIAPCSLGISCTSKYVEYFGFITIPFMAFVGFSIITISLFYYWRSNK